MTRLTISDRDRRTLLTGAVVIAVTLGLSKGLPTIRSWEAERVAAAGEARALRELADLSARELSGIRDTLAARTRRLDSLRAPMISGASTDAAAAALAALVERLADDSGIAVSTVVLNPDSVATGGFARVAVRLSGEGDVAALLDLLQILEARRTPLYVDELSVAQLDPSAPKNKVEVLRFDVVVRTLARIRTQAKPERRS